MGINEASKGKRNVTGMTLLKVIAMRRRKSRRRRRRVTAISTAAG